jgi:hypothetical protein
MLQNREEAKKKFGLKRRNIKYQHKLKLKNAKVQNMHAG